MTTFAYPFGAVDERVRDAAAAVFDAAFTIDEGLNTLATDPLMLRRTVVQPDDTALDSLFRLADSDGALAPTKAAGGPRRIQLTLRTADAPSSCIPARIRSRRDDTALFPGRRAATIRFGSLRRTKPISSDFGFDRGLPVDRHYIEEFLRQHADDLRGRVLEVGDDRYASALGGDSVESISVLNLSPAGVANEIVDDLAQPQRLRAEAFDCVICAQTLHLIYDVRTAIGTPGSDPASGRRPACDRAGISRISSDPDDAWEDHWRLTCASATRLFGDVFGDGNVGVRGYGNVLSAIAFLHGIAAEELDRDELRHPRSGVRRPDRSPGRRGRLARVVPGGGLAADDG